MPLDVEEIVDGTVDGCEALRLALRFEALHLSFSSPHSEMRVFCTVVVAQSPGSVTPATSQCFECGSVREQAIGHEVIRDVALSFQQSPQQSQRCMLVAALLNENVQHLAFVIDRTPVLSG